RKFNIYNYTDGKSETSPALKGIFHDNGYAVATDTHIVVASKEDYDAEHEGQLVTKDGDVLEFRFPNWRSLLNPDPKAMENPMPLDCDALLGSIASVEAKLKADKIGPKKIAGTMQLLRLPNGDVGEVDLSTLKQFAIAAKHFGAKEIAINGSGMIYTSTEKGCVLCYFNVHGLQEDYDYEKIGKTTFGFDMRGKKQGEQVKQEKSKEGNVGNKQHKVEGRDAEVGDVLPDDAAMRDALIERLEGAGIEVQDGEEAKAVLDAAKGNIKEMGSRVESRKKDIANKLSIDGLNEAQQAVVSVFTGSANNNPIVVERKDGNRRVIIRKGNENGGGVEYSILKHYDTTRGSYVANDITLIPEIIAKGEITNKQRGNTKLVEYKYTKDGITYTVVTEINRNREEFADFYTNKKGLPATRKTRSEEARVKSDETFDAANLSKENETTKSGGIKLQKKEQSVDAKQQKEKQLEIINKSNPAPDSYHTWVRSTDDILTLQEAVDELLAEDEGYELSSYPDVSDETIREALRTGKIRVYSSKPIKNGAFVTPSMMQAKDYAGRGSVYSKEVPISDVAWLNTDEGQYAATSKNANDKDTGIRYFRTSKGEVYGFTDGEKIYIDRKIAGVETPIHEYTHLWAQAMRKANPEEWNNIIELMRGTNEWEKVKKNYPELTTDDEITEEVLAHYSGRRGAERLKAEQKKVLESDASVLDKAAAVDAIERVKQALSRFWKAVSEWFDVH
ncbi:MAG: hypothetical protein ACI4BC_08900, partial [Muribaculaceae bacterium]